MTAQVDDRETAPGALVRSAAAGDATAWSALVQRFSGLVWSVARSHRLGTADAEEVYQTTWLRLTEHLARLTDPDRVGAWLATTARHESLRVIKVGGRVHATDDPSRRDPGTDEGSPEQALLDLEAAQADRRRSGQLWSAFQRLPERCRALLSMVVIAVPPLSYTEVSESLGMPVGSIGPTRARCLQRLRAMLAEPQPATG